MSFFFLATLTIFLLFCVILCFLILIQDGKGGGLGASFGGGGDASDSLFGTSTPDVLKKLTSYLALIFVAFCLVLSFWTASVGRNHHRFSGSEAILDQQD